MESLTLQILEYWWAYVIVLVAVIVGVSAYLAFLKRLERHVAKTWLSVYETYLRRADKLPLLVEIVRRDTPEYMGVAKELIAARQETQGMSLPSVEKRNAERGLSEAVTRVLESVSHHESLKKNGQFLGLAHELSIWDEHLPLQVVNYSKALTMYRIFSLGGFPKGYVEFDA